MKVLDFYSDNEALIASTDTLFNNTTFYVLVRRGDRIKELAFFIPRKYKFKRSLISNDFKVKKLREYNVLVDFLKFSKGKVQARFHLEETEYEELLIGLKATLFREYMYEGTSILKRLARFAEVVEEIIKLYFCNALLDRYK